MPKALFRRIDEVGIPVFSIVIIAAIAERVRLRDRAQAAAVFKVAVRSVDVFTDDISRRIEKLHHVALQVIDVVIDRTVGVFERHALAVVVVIEHHRRIVPRLLREVSADSFRCADCAVRFFVRSFEKTAGRLAPFKGFSGDMTGKMQARCVPNLQM